MNSRNRLLILTETPGTYRTLIQDLGFHDLEVAACPTTTSTLEQARNPKQVPCSPVINAVLARVASNLKSGTCERLRNF